MLRGMSISPTGLCRLAATLAAGAALGACSHAAPQPGDDARPLQLLVRSAGDWPDAAAFAQRAAERAGVPVRGARIVGPRRYALTLLCIPGAGCDEARRRLLGDGSVIAEVQVDARRALPRPPAASQAL